MALLGSHLRVTAVMSFGGLIALENVYHVHVDAVPGTPTDLNVMDDMAEWLDGAYTHLAGNMRNSVGFIEVRGFNVTNAQPLPTVAWPTLTAGLGPSDLAATGAALLVLFHTVKSRVLGRKFLGGFTEGVMTDGLWVAGVVADALAFAVDIATPFTGTHSGCDFTCGVYSKAGVFYTFPRQTVSSVPAYQRRRRLGRGI